jgi:hypothetical protein
MPFEDECHSRMNAIRKIVVLDGRVRMWGFEGGLG